MDSPFPGKFQQEFRKMFGQIYLERDKDLEMGSEEKRQREEELRYSD